jgi:5'-nucleotidase
VGAALEGTLHGIASLAISIGSKRNPPLGPAAAFAAELAKWILQHGLPPGVSLNVNVPPDWNSDRKSGVRLTRLAQREARRLRLDPENAGDPNSFAIREEIDSGRLAPDSDYRAVREGCVSITPLALECADFPSLAWLEDWIRMGGNIPACP